jgi:hypothetical protein
MTPRATDLTQIAKKNGGEFPFDRVLASIDGTRQVAAHGGGDMPVWGEVFADQAGQSSAERAQVRGKLQLLTEYIRSIQVH